ncbi:MAG: hypothetical protein NVS1B16_02020 [Pseudarthrobacter sp.]
MPHLDPERLSLLALYDDWADDDGRDHLGSCPSCSADHTALRRVVTAVKTAPDASSLEVPGPQVWAGIHRELGLSQAVQEDPLAAPAEQPTTPRQPTARAARRRTPAWWQRPGTWLAAAAATLLVAGATLWTLNQAPQPLARADLTPLAQYSATGSARVVRASDGSRRLEVKVSKDEAKGYQEVWLMAADHSRLVSLGVMNSDSGTFEVPASLQLADFPIVDVSDEPLDGNPAHSTVSIVRGTLNS